MATEEDFFNFFSSLAPADQRKFLASFGGTQENLDDQAAYTDDPYAQVPAELGGVGSPQMDMTSQMLGQLAGGAYPQYTSSGKLDPLDLSQMSQRLNYTQDLGGSMFDNAIALFAGPDAFGSMDQFTPITKYTGAAVPAEVDESGQPRPVTKSQKMLEIAKKSGGARGFLADLIDQGQDPEAAVAALRDLVSRSANATNLTPEQQKQIKDIRNTLDVWRTNDPLTGQPKPVDRNTAPWEQFDEESLRKTAQDMFEQKLSDEMDASTLEFDPQTGKYYQGKTTEDSPAAKKFRDAGLPLPGEQYTDPARMQAMMQSVDPSGYDRSQALAATQSDAADSLEAQRQKLLASQLDLQNYDRQLKAKDQGDRVKPGATYNPNMDQGMPPVMPSQRMGQGMLPVPQAAATRVGFTAPTPHFTNLNGRQAPRDVVPRTVMDSFGNPHQVTEQDFNFGDDLTRQIFANMPQTGQGVRTDQRSVLRTNAPAQRQQNLAAQQQWNDQYNRNYAAQHRRQSAPDESNADFLAGMMRARARQTTPLQDTMLARLLSLKSRAGI
jgi:hypothetical protein